jgi:hypothetical protein
MAHGQVIPPLGVAFSRCIRPLDALVISIAVYQRFSIRCLPAAALAPA